MKMDQFNRSWIIENALEELSNYEPGTLTIRGLHYRLVSRGMTNSMRHYKRVVSAMISCRWDNQVSFETFSDHDREVLGVTEADETTVDKAIDRAEWVVDHYLNRYNKNMWENQPIYPEVFIEKKALQGLFEPICQRFNVALSPCKGYPSLTFLYEASQRFIERRGEGKEPTILYFGDYDPSGEDIPRSIGENLSKMGVSVNVIRIALLEEQVIDLGLPPAPAKVGDSRTSSWDGLGQVELDAVEPNLLKSMARDAILSIRDEDLYQELLRAQSEELSEYRTRVREMILDQLQ